MNTRSEARPSLKWDNKLYNCPISVIANNRISIIRQLSPFNRFNVKIQMTQLNLPILSNWFRS